jgi:transposase-like protein
MPSQREALSDAEANALHAWVRQFDPRQGGRGLGMEPWYLDGTIPPEATAVSECNEKPIATARRRAFFFGTDLVELQAVLRALRPQHVEVRCRDDEVGVKREVAVTASPANQKAPACRTIAIHMNCGTQCVVVSKPVLYSSGRFIICAMRSWTGLTEPRPAAASIA